MRTEEFESDLTVVGGGLAGVCAAIAAARAGRRTALVQNRPVLGGNSSSEIRVWVCGATAHGTQHYARETGIMGELFVENQYRNPDGNPYYWDLTVLEAVRAEPNLTLFLNTEIRDVDADGPPDDRRILSATGWQSGSERILTFRSPAYADCSGDGLVGHLAGADYRTGREPRSRYGEEWAPETPDDNTLGSTILFYTKDAGHPVKYVPPPFATDITKTPIPERRIIRTDMNGCAYWWIEWGGGLDVVHDNEAIRDELQAACYGIWDHIKNSGKFDAANLTLEWIGSVPGKREYRRFTGDHTLTQHDILGQKLFPDRIGFGGWSIDLHPAGGMYAAEPGSRHWHPDGVYHLPLRSFYPRNVRNMWMAGRSISASHVAFGTTRVMATCAVGGEAVGIAAALALDLGATPREVARDHLPELHRRMVRSDASVLGVAADDPDDLAPAAAVSAGSHLARIDTGDDAEPAGPPQPLDVPLGLTVPVDPRLDTVELLVDATADTELVLEVHDPVHPQNYLPVKPIRTVSAPVPAGARQWVRLQPGVQPDAPQNVFLVLPANPAIRLHRAAETLPGTLFFAHREPPENERWTEQWRAWKKIWHREGGLRLRLTPDTAAYAPARAVGGYARPWGGPQMWVSDRLDRDPAPRLTLDWPEPVEFTSVELVLDDDVEEDLINLHHHTTPFDTIPELLRDYRIEARTADGPWRELAATSGNRRRHRVHRLPAPVRADRLRLTATATNGAPRAHVVALRVYRS